MPRGKLVVVAAPADAQPTDAEREVWQQVDVVLKDAKGILDELQAYKGAGVEIREVGPSPPRPTAALCLHVPCGNVSANFLSLSRPSRTPTMRRYRSRRGPPWFPWWGN